MALTPQQRQNLKKRFIEGIKNAINGDPGNTIGGQPVEDFIAGPQPSGPLGQFQWESGRRVCRRWAAGRSPTILPGRDIYYRQLCEPYIEDTFGPLGDGIAEPPFTGGQCESLFYRATGTVEYDVLVCSTGTVVPISDSRTTEAIFIGPVLSITPVYSNPGACGNRDFIFEIVHNGGATTSTAFFTTNATNRVLNARFSGGFELAGGGSGGCGDPPDDWSPGTGPTIPPESGPIPSPPGWPIPDFDIDITVDPGGTINIDFGDGEPPEQIEPDPTEPPSFPPEPEPGDQGEPGTGGEAGAADAEGEAPPGSVLVGVRLQLTEAPPNAKTFAPVVYRGAAYIYMGGDVALDQDYAGSMLVSDQFIYAEKDNLTRWKVKANQGFRWNVTPYYREVQK